MNVPSCSRVMINKFMKVSHILEARYYGRHALNDVLRHYQKIVDDYRHHKDVGMLEAYKDKNAVYGEMCVYDVDTAEELKREVRDFMKANKAPYDDIDFIVDNRDPGDSTFGWTATLVYKGEPPHERPSKHKQRQMAFAQRNRINEARYYGRHTRKDVIKQYQKAIDKGKHKRNAYVRAWSGPAQNVFLRSMEVTDDYLWGDIFVKDATGPDEDVADEIEQYLKDMNVPITKIYDIGSHHDGNGQLSSWEATTVLELDSYLTEAKYYRQLSLHDANKEYQDAYDRGHDARGMVRMQRPELFRHSRGDFVSCDFLLPEMREIEATQAVREFAQKYKVPYTHLKANADAQLNNPRSKSYWRVTLRYVPVITEAKYYKGFDINEVLAQYRAITDQQEQGASVGIAGSHITHDKVFATVWAFDVDTALQFSDTIERFMRKNEAPYDELLDIDESDEDVDEGTYFQGIVIYRKKKQ